MLVQSMPVNIKTFEGSNYFRQRFVLATLSGKSVKVKKIHCKAADPGVTGLPLNYICLGSSFLVYNSAVTSSGRSAASSWQLGHQEVSSI